MLILTIAALLLAAWTVWYVTVPLRRPLAVGGEQREQMEMVRDRLLAQLKELELERADQTIDVQVAEAEQSRLEYELAQVLSGLDRLPAGQTETAQLPRWLRFGTAGVVAAAVPLVAGILYLQQNLDDLSILARIGDGEQQVAGADGEVPPMVAEMVGRLEKRLQAQPDDAAGWAQLGRSYAVLNRRADAEAAYGRAYALTPDEPGVLSEYAWLVYSADPARPSALAAELYGKLHQANPGNQDALWVLGLTAYQEGNLKRALKLWEELHATLPKDSPAEKGVATAIQQLREKSKER